MKAQLVGRSLNTRIKYQNLHKFYWFHFCFTRNAIFNHPRFFEPTYFYVDLNAGDGYCEKYGYGSPIIAAKTAAKAKIDWNPFFVEKCPKNAQLLKHHFDQFGHSEYRDRVINDDYANFLASVEPKTKKSQLGLLFADPNGICDLYEKAIADFVSDSPRVDVMIHINSTTIKRVAGAIGATKDLTSIMQSIAEAKIKASGSYRRYRSWREVWHIREPFWSGGGYWTLLFCCLTKKFKADQYRVELSQTKKGEVEIGTLNSLQSERGQEIFDFLTLKSSDFQLKYGKSSYTKNYKSQLSLNLGV